MTMTASITLKDHIRAHDQRVHELIEAIRAAEDEISIHEALIALARNDRLVAAVEELHDKKAQTSHFAMDPQAYCTEQGIVLAEGVTLNPLDTSGSSSARMTAVLRRAGHDVQVRWDSKTGFSASGVPNRIIVLAAQQILGPGQGANFPTYASPKQTTLCVMTQTGQQQGTVNILAGEAQESLSTTPNGGQQCIQRDWAGVVIGVTNTSGTNVLVWTG